MSNKNQEKTNNIVSPKWTKKQKILYFLWLDEQIMFFWGLYLDKKYELPDDDFWSEEEKEELDEYLKTIEYFEDHQSELVDEYSYEEIDEFIKRNPVLCKNFTFFRFFT